MSDSSSDGRGLRHAEPRVRKVAVHVTGEPAPFIGCGADRYWVGIRGSVTEFLARARDRTLDRWVETALKSRRKVGLVTPHVVDQAGFEDVVSVIADFSGRVDRVLTGDPGVAASVSEVVRVYWCGQVCNVDHVYFLHRIGVRGVRAIRPVSTGAMDINRDIDLEMPVFGRIPLAFMPDVHENCDPPSPVALYGRGGAVIVRSGYIESADFLDLSDSLRPFGRDTCGVVETSGLEPDEVSEAVDAIRFGRAVETRRPLFVSDHEAR